MGRWTRFSINYRGLESVAATLMKMVGQEGEEESLQPVETIEGRAYLLGVDHRYGSSG